MATRVRIQALIAAGLFMSFVGLEGCVATQADEADTQDNTQHGSADNGLTTKLPCCPQGWDLYYCPTSPGGPITLHCHNPKMECPSVCTNSSCDFAVSGVCPSTT